MTVIQSFGAVRALVGESPVWGSPSGSISMYDGHRQSYAKIYATQPSVRTVVDFLARNIAQIGLHLYDRVSDTDRVRVVSHEALDAVTKPNGWTTRYRLMRDLVQDLCIYDNAFWLKVRAGGRIGQVRLPPEFMQTHGGLGPTGYTLTYGGRQTDFPTSEIVHFRGTDPCNPNQGLSSIETLRRVLLEEAAAGAYRQYFWRNAAQLGGVIERPKEAGHWTPDKVRDFQEMWGTRFAGAVNAGKTPILQDGMQFKPATESAKSSQYVEGRKLTREEVAAAYHVPLPMVGILDHATFSNIREQHKQLYQDCFGPWLAMVEEELELQLLPEFDDDRRLYFEFNIAEKLKGSFEEQAGAIRSLTGGAPIMTQNEGRARLNLPKDSDPESDKLPKSLNFQQGEGGAPKDPDAENPAA